MPESIQVSFPETFNPKSIIFEPVQKKNPQEGVSYYSSPIKMRYPDGTTGPIILQMPRCPTYGISTKYSDLVDKVNLSVQVGENSGSNEEFKDAINAINGIVAAAKVFTLTDAVKSKLGEYDLEEANLKEMAILKPQKDKETKKPLMDRPPIMNIRMMTKFDKDTKQKVCDSVFADESVLDEDGNPTLMDYRNLFNKRGTCVVLIKFESIYYGAKKKIQCKVYQCDFKPVDNTFKSLIVRKSTASFGNSVSAPTEDFDYASDDDEPVKMVTAPPQVDEEEDEEDDVASTVSQPKADSPKRSASPPPAEKQPPTKTVRRGAKGK